MIILTNTTDKIQVKLGTTVTTTQLKCFTSYRDTTTTSITPGRTAITTNNTTFVDAVPAPSASTQRIVDYMSIQNTDTVNQTVNIVFNDNGTIYELFITTLASGEKIEFQEGLGFKVLTNAGSVKTSMNQGNTPITSSLQAVILGIDQVNANVTANTMQDITGLSFSVTAGNRYYFKFVCTFGSAATTTGTRFAINGPTSPTFLSYMSEYTLAATTTTRNPTVQAYDTPATSSANVASTIQNLAIIEGYIIPSADGVVVGRFASEVSASAITVKAGSVLYWQQL